MPLDSSKASSNLIRVGAWDSIPLTRIYKAQPKNHGVKIGWEDIETTCDFRF